MSNKWRFRAAYVALFVGSAAFAGYVGSQAFASQPTPAPVRGNAGLLDAKLVAQAWAGAVETGNTKLACEFAAGVSGCEAQMAELAQALHTQSGYIAVGEAVGRAGSAAVQVVVVVGGQPVQEARLLVKGHRWVGIAA